MRGISKTIVLLLLGLLLGLGAKAQAPNWGFTTSTDTHQFHLPASMAICCTPPLDSGDFVGVFYDSLGTYACGGYLIWNGGNQNLIAYSDDTLTIAKEGFSVDEVPLWKTFHLSSSQEYAQTVLYAHSGQYPDSNHFVVNGASELLYMGNCQAPVFQTHIIGASCNGEADGSAWVEIISLNPPYEIEWSDGTQNDTITDLAAGNYQVVVTNANGDTSIQVVTITQPDSLVLSYTVSPNTSSGLPTGSIDLTVSGGTAPYQFVWNNGITTEDLNVAFAGVYWVTVSDYNACTADDTIVINNVVEDPWSYTSTYLDHEVFFPENTLVLFNGSTIENGDVIGVFYDSLGMSRCAGKFVFENGFGLQGTTLVAQGDLSSTFEKEGFGQGETFNWKIWDASEAVEYEVYASYIDSVLWPNQGFYAINGKSAVAMLGDVEHDLGISSWLEPNGYCNLTNSESITIEVFSQGLVPAYSCTLSYSVNGGAWVEEIWNQAVFYNDTLEYSFNTPADLGIPAFYHLKAFVSVQNDENPHNDTLEVSFYPIQVVSIEVPDTMFTCVGSSSLIIWGGTAPYNVSWNDPQQQNGSVAAQLCSGVYVATITDQRGCSFTYEVEIENIVPPGFNATYGDVSCYGENDGYIIISPTNFQLPITYSWSNGAISKDLNNIGPGVYSLTITDGTGLSASGTYQVTEPPALVVDADWNNVLCYGQSTGSINLDVSGGTSPYNYTWSNGSVQEDLDQIPAGDYIVSVVDQHTCLVTQYIEIDQAPQLVVNFVVSDISTAGANDGSILLSMFGATPPHSFSWGHGESVQNINNLSQGYYFLTVSDNSNCHFTYDSLFVDEPYPVLSGRIMMGPNPSPDGVVVLCREDQNQLVKAIDLCFTNNGFYSFSISPEGKYLVYAIPNPDYGIQVFPSYFPTYLGDTLEWDNSQRIETDTNQNNQDIHLEVHKNIFYGNGLVTGRLTYWDESVYETDVFDQQWFDDTLIVKSSGFQPARNIPILLKHENQHTVLFSLTHADGSFNLDNVEYGQYTLHAEKPGYHSQEIVIILSEEEPVVSNIEMYIEPAQIVVGVSDLDAFGPEVISVFPNPVSELLMIDFRTLPVEIEEIRLYSIDGIKKISIPGNEIQSKSLYVLQTSKLTAGVYILDIGTKQNEVIKRRILKI